MDDARRHVTRGVCSDLFSSSRHYGDFNTLTDLHGEPDVMYGQFRAPTTREVVHRLTGPLRPAGAARGPPLAAERARRRERHFQLEPCAPRPAVRGAERAARVMHVSSLWKCDCRRSRRHTRHTRCPLLLLLLLLPPPPPPLPAATGGGTRLRRAPAARPVSRPSKVLALTPWAPPSSA